MDHKFLRVRAARLRSHRHKRANSSYTDVHVNISNILRFAEVVMKIIGLN